MVYRHTFLSSRHDLLPRGDLGECPWHLEIYVGKFRGSFLPRPPQERDTTSQRFKYAGLRGSVWCGAAEIEDVDEQLPVNDDA